MLTALTLAAVALLALVLPTQQASSAGLRDELRVVSRKPVLLAIATTAVGFSGVAVVFTYIAPLLTRIVGFSPAAVSALLFAYGAGSFLGNLAAGKLTDRSMSATVRGVFCGLTGVLVAMPFAATWQPTAVLAVLVLGLLATATIAPLQGLILRLAGSAPTLAVAVNVGAFNLGAAAGSALGGAIVAAGALRWTRLLPEQQERLSTLGIKPLEKPSPAPAAGCWTEGPSKAQQAFQRGLAALAQWVEREGADRPVPRGHSEEIAVDGETEPVVVKLGVWVSNTNSRRDKLTQEQLDALAELGVDWA